MYTMILYDEEFLVSGSYSIFLTRRLLLPVLTSLSLIFSCNLTCRRYTRVCTWVSSSVHAYDSNTCKLCLQYRPCTQVVVVSKRLAQRKCMFHSDFAKLVRSTMGLQLLDLSYSPLGETVIVVTARGSYLLTWTHTAASDLTLGPRGTLSFALLLFVNSLARSGSLGRTTSYCIFQTLLNW